MQVFYPGESLPVEQRAYGTYLQAVKAAWRRVSGKADFIHVHVVDTVTRQLLFSTPEVKPYDEYPSPR
jgi:hypothetical protein